ncbi:MAG: zinc ribbon domain-containing protein [Actinomycetota bacterium]|nr:zinc ribbon domain-containing protein [Actinomycetota bacterium]
MTRVAGIFGIQSHTLSLVVDLLVVLLVVIWLALVYWTWADARRRIADGVLVACAAIASLFPFIGTLIYTIVRPPEYLADVRERDLEIQAAKARLAQIGMHSCPYCDHEVENDFLRCPSCLRRLKEPCASCGRPLAADWRICPYCEADREPDAAMAASPRRRRVRRDPQQTIVAPPPSDLL